MRLLCESVTEINHKETEWEIIRAYMVWERRTDKDRTKIINK